MHSNNEVGTIQPIKIIGKIIQSYNLREKTNILFHSDAAQSLGKVRVDARSLGVDLLTIVGHKYGAPKGHSLTHSLTTHSRTPIRSHSHSLTHAL